MSAKGWIGLLPESLPAYRHRPLRFDDLNEILEKLRACAAMARRLATKEPGELP